MTDLSPPAVRRGALRRSSRTKRCAGTGSCSKRASRSNSRRCAVPEREGCSTLARVRLHPGATPVELHAYAPSGGYLTRVRLGEDHERPGIEPHHDLAGSLRTQAVGEWFKCVKVARKRDLAHAFHRSRAAFDDRLGAGAERLQLRRPSDEGCHGKHSGECAHLDFTFRESIGSTFALAQGKPNPVGRLSNVRLEA